MQFADLAQPNFSGEWQNLRSRISTARRPPGTPPASG